MKLVLVKHAMPVVADGVTPARWILSEEGRRATADLARDLSSQGIVRVFCSPEPKATETARILADRLRVPCEMQRGLEEHDRSNITRLDSPGGFETSVRGLFSHPDDVVYGTESATTALHRFRAAVTDIISRNIEGPIAIVSHGTVIALFVAHLTGRDGFAIWKSLALPGVIVVEYDGR